MAAHADPDHEDPDHEDPDHEQAASEAAARRRLLGSGAASLPRMPWLAGRQPPAAADLIQFALWQGHAGRSGEDDVLAALTLLPAARAEVDQIEAALLFTADSCHTVWIQFHEDLLATLGIPRGSDG
ncbi:MAG: DNA-binding protein [Streptosporangiaceae bacterium]